MVILSFLFFALDYWHSVVLNNDIYNVPAGYRNSNFSVTRGWGSSITVAAENLKLVEIDWQIKSLIFSSDQNLDNPKFPQFAITFVLSRDPKSSSSACTGFISSTKVAIEMHTPLRSISGNNYPVRSLRSTSDSPKMSKSFFSIWSFLDFVIRVLPYLLTWCLPSRSQSNASNLS